MAPSIYSTVCALRNKATSIKKATLHSVRFVQFYTYCNAYSDSQPIASTPHPRHQPILLFMTSISTLLLLTYLQLKVSDNFFWPLYI
jgi:hypothetical protein